MDKENKLMLIVGVMFVAIILALGVMFGIHSLTENQKMNTCVSTGDHSWVQKHGDYYECIPDSEVGK